MIDHVRMSVPNVALEARGLQIPLRLRHKQASFDRVCGDSIWAEARRGLVLGIGEGCPRDYVTGERAETSLAWLELLLPEIGETIVDLAALRRYVHDRGAQIDHHPGAWCAIELALLDLFAREAGVSIEHLLQVPEQPSKFRYCAVLSDVELDVSRELVARAVAAGIHEFKIKLGGDLERDRARLNLVRAACSSAREQAARLRLDANNLWGDRVDDAISHLSKLGPFDAVEEPLRPRAFAELARTSRELGIPVILDESLSLASDFAALDQHRAAWIANLKVSKCGGLLRALALVDAARERGVPVLIGAQVGETSVLTRAGIALARAASSSVIGMEGAAGLLLLEREVVRPVLQLGPGGIVDIETLDLGAHGLGLTPVQHHGLVATNPAAT